MAWQDCELDRFLIEFKFEYKNFYFSSSAKMIEFKFEFTALFKISLKQTYPNQERIRKILVGGCSFDLV